MALRALTSAIFLALAIAAASLPFRTPPPDPRSSALWIDRGLAEERSGDFASAERDLLTAARFDRQYLPAWTLANFYFRRGDRDSFWRWARRAAAMSYDDFAPLLKLADALDPGQALDRLGNPPRAADAYLDLLINDDRVDDALAISPAIHDPARLRAFTTWLIAAGRAADAITIWHRIPPSFDPTGEGFDWRIVSHGAFRGGSFDFELDGAQPEAIPLLERIVPGGVQLRFEYRSDLDDLRWALDANESAPLARAADWRSSTADFPAPRGLHRLRLFYRRSPGHTRAAGRVKLRNLRSISPSGLSY